MPFIEQKDATEDRKIEMILRQLEKLDHSSQDANLRLQQFTEKLFGHVHEAENRPGRISSSESTNLCETIFWRVSNITSAMQSISMEIDTMMAELPPESKILPNAEPR